MSSKSSFNFAVNASSWRRLFFCWNGNGQSSFHCQETALTLHGGLAAAGKSAVEQ
jgi:hypothetical protein